MLAPSSQISDLQALASPGYQGSMSKAEAGLLGQGDGERGAVGDIQERVRLQLHFVHWPC